MRHHNEGHRNIAFTHPGEQEEAIVVGQTKVRKYQVYTVGPSLCQPSGGGSYIGNLFYIETFFLEPCLQHCAKGQVVFHYQYLFHLTYRLFYANVL